MSTWNIYTLNDSDVWVLDSTIPRPNEDMADELVHNQQKKKLADGSDVFVSPETRTSKLPLTMVWYNQEKSFVDRVKQWMIDHDYLKIETHIDDYEFIGRFINVVPAWLKGIDEKWNVTAVFEQME